MRCTLLFLIVLGLLSPLASSAQYVVAECGSYALVNQCLRLWQFTDGYDDPWDGYCAWQLAVDLNLTYYELLQANCSYTSAPVVSTQQILNYFGYPSVVDHVSTHGVSENPPYHPAGILGESYAYYSDRNEVWDYYVDGGYFTEYDQIFKSQVDWGGVMNYDIGINGDFLAYYYCCSARSIFFANFCLGHPWVGELGAGSAIGFHPILPNPTAIAAADTFFTYMSGRRGRENRCVQAAFDAMPSTGGTWHLHGCGNTVLTPAVDEDYIDPPVGSQLDRVSQTISIPFDAAVQVSGSLQNAVEVGGFIDEFGDWQPYATVLDVRLIDDLTLEIDLQLDYLGTYPITIRGDKFSGRNSQGQLLDGNTDPWGYGEFGTGRNCHPPNGDDYLLWCTSLVGEDPAALVTGFKVTEVNGQLQGEVETASEVGTDHFEVFRKSAGDQEWQLVFEFPGEGDQFQGATYQFALPGKTGDYFRLEEVELSGHRLTYHTEQAIDQYPVLPTFPGGEVKGQQFYLPEEYGEIGLPGTKTDVDVLHICADDSCRTEIQPLVLHQELIRGLSGEIVTLAEIGPNPTKEEIRHFIVTYSDSMHYVVLYGDDNWTDPDLQVIPTWSIDYPWGCWSNQAATDDMYVDQEGNREPELIIGRVPVSNVQQLRAFVEKSINWDYYSEPPQSRHRALVFSEDEDLGNCSGALAQLMTDDIVSNLPGLLQQYAYILRDSDFNSGGYYEREEAALNAINNLGYGLWIACGTQSKWLEYAGFLDKWFSGDGLIDYFLPTEPSVGLLFCCGTADFAHGAEMQDLTTDLLVANGRGLVATLGFTENTQQHINWEIANKVVSKLQQSGDLAIGEIWLQVKQEMFAKYPEELYPQIHAQIHSLVLLGDPTVSYSWPGVYTGAEELNHRQAWLAQNQPNPFNPTTTIAFSLPVDSPVSLAVYDVAGRQVIQLIDRPLEAGRYQVSWDGNNHHGIRVASGVYLIRLEALGQSSSRKMTLLK